MLTNSSKFLLCVFLKKKNSTIIGLGKIDPKFKKVKIKINGNNLCQMIRYRFPKHETIDQLESLFVFDLEAHNDQEFAAGNAAGLYDVNRLRVSGTDI